MPGVQPTDREWEAATRLLVIIKKDNQTSEGILQDMMGEGYTKEEIRVGLGMVYEGVLGRPAMDHLLE